jgi:hypothetical protein
VERVYKLSPNEVIEVALPIIQRFNNIHPQFSFTALAPCITQVLIEIPDIVMSEVKRQEMCSQLFKELEQGLLLNSHDPLLINGSDVVN